MRLMRFRSVYRGIYSLMILCGWCIFCVEVASEEDTTGLKLHFEKLVQHYESKKVTSDCNVNGAGSSWGTLKTLKFLTAKYQGSPKLKHGDKLTNVTKLRVFLSRVGYLKVPGSLVFLDKQAETLRLDGCGADAIWKMQGERGSDLAFHQSGETLKISAPNSANYIQKFTCVNLGKCSHTFYVITRLLPELPLGVQLRENGEIKEDDGFLLNCAVPYCNVKTCKVGKTDKDMNRRAYPPYTIKWSFMNRDPVSSAKVYQSKMLKDLKMIENPLTNSQEHVFKNLGMKVLWEKKIRKDKSADEASSHSYANAKDAEWRDSFGENHKNKNFSFNSRILIKKAKQMDHNGPYECILEDANGVVSTPSVFPTTKYWMEYRGKANVHVTSLEFLYVTLGVCFACMILLFLIILACPKKMEYDDGTRYTKEELISPEKQQSEPVEDEGTNTVSSSQKLQSTKEETIEKTDKE